MRAREMERERQRNKDRRGEKQIEVEKQRERKGEKESYIRAGRERKTDKETGRERAGRSIERKWKEEGEIESSIEGENEI